jgi:hypothetical protein
MSSLELLKQEYKEVLEKIQKLENRNLYDYSVGNYTLKDIYEDIEELKRLRNNIHLYETYINEIKKRF